MEKQAAISFLLVFIVFVVFITKVVSSEIIITEIMYDPGQCSDNYCEYIEIYNNDSSDVNLTGWRLCSDGLLAGYINNSTGNLTSNNSLILQAGYYALITDGGTGTLVYDNFNVSNNSIAIHVNSSSMCSNGLNNSGENISIYDNNNSLKTSLIYSSSWGANGTNKSLQLCNGSWIENWPTPGTENNCTQVSKNSSSPNNNTGKPDENKSYKDEDITIELEWDKDEIINGKEFEITVKANNLKSGEDYDIKVEIQNEDKATISETYGNHGEDEDNWETSRNYLLKVFSGGGDKSEKIKLRIDRDYDDFKGDATIIAKIRKTGTTSAIDKFEDKIKILEKVNDSSSTSSSSSLNSRNSNLSTSSADGTTDLGSKSQTKEYNKNSIVYKSPSEYIKEYAPYSFSLFCIILIALLLMDKYKIRIRIEKGEETENV